MMFRFLNVCTPLYNNLSRATAPLDDSRQYSSMKTLWIGDLQSHWDSAFIGAIFANLGDVPTVKIIKDRVTGQPAGFGFLEFSTQEAAQKALTKLNNTVVPGTTNRIRLNWGGGGGGRRPDDDDVSIFVGDLSSEVTDDILMATFTSRFTTVRGAKVVTDPSTGQGKGYGFVRFGNRLEYEQALSSMGGVYCGSKPMRVSHATDRRKLQQQSVAAAYGTAGAYPYSSSTQQQQQYQAYYSHYQSPQASAAYPQQYAAAAYSAAAATYSQQQQVLPNAAAYSQQAAVAVAPPTPVLAAPTTSSSSTAAVALDFTKLEDPGVKNSEYIGQHMRQYYEPSIQECYQQRLESNSALGTAMAYN